ncbi:hypothetical protein KY316_01650, partial [Candidatus Woesearchaeota archaeon]|nr:hypothetical protein [Candidatus Woesearchaeota archaeon]
MGGCYNDFSSNCRPAYQRPAYQRPKRKPNPKWGKCMKDFARTHSLDDLLAANKAFFRSRKKGFIAKLAEACDIKNVADIPKEFPETEYEVKFDITPAGKGEEPSIVQYLDAFDFPVGGATRFLKDPVNNFAIGTNHFIGDEHDERLVVIEKCGNNYVKEKGKVVQLQLGIPYEGIVIKRTEARAPAEMSEVIEKIRQATSEKGVEYRGKIRKEKG